MDERKRVLEPYKQLLQEILNMMDQAVPYWYGEPMKKRIRGLLSTPSAAEPCPHLHKTTILDSVHQPMSKRCDDCDEDLPSSEESTTPATPPSSPSPGPIRRFRVERCCDCAFPQMRVFLDQFDGTVDIRCSECRVLWALL